MPISPRFRNSSNTLFTPTVIRGLNQDGRGMSSDGAFGSSNVNQVANTTLGHSSSFRYDPVGTGLKSTQQLNVDWTKFENHVFFNSARVKVNSTFVKIFNSFPFDGTKREFELFIDGLTGYEKYVYDSFPKHTGYLFLSGTRDATASGTFVMTQDLQGADYPTLSRTTTGTSVLNPGSSESMTIEFQLFVPPVSNSNQVVLQKISDLGSSLYQGFGIQLLSTGSTSDCQITMTAVSNSHCLVTQGASLIKDQFNHVAFVWDRTPGVSSISTFVNNALVASSSAVEVGNMACDSAKLFIGSGSAIPPIGFTPTNTLSGALDELRIWHTVRTQQERNEFSTKNVYAEPALKLYYKFNECPNNDTPVVIDHSGNGLHGSISSWALTNGIRDIPSGNVAGPSPISSERQENNPVLFSDVSDVVDLQLSLLTSAEEYDHNNPNLITKLFPPHFFFEGQQQDGLSTEEGEIVNDYQSSGLGEAQVGETQVLLGLMWTWAKFFDEMKLYVDAFTNIIHVDYGNADTVPDQFLQILADRYGVQLPALFQGTSIEQYINAENLDSAYSVSSQSLLQIQNQIWRRLLVNIKDILNSKGTIHSVKAFIRSLGIDPDNNFHIREFGGPTKRALKVSREQRSEASSMLSFKSGGRIVSPFLSGTRIETGWPFTSSTVPNANDGLYTSGSWTWEGIYKITGSSEATQSLMRLQSTGSLGTNLLFNLVATSGSGVTLYGKPNGNTLATALTMSLDGFNPMDGQLWNISFGRDRGDSLDAVSSSYFLRAAKQSFGLITEIHTASHWFNDNYPLSASNALQLINSASNASGSFIAIGSGTFGATGLSSIHLNSGEAATHVFNGNVAQLRFWSKGLDSEEWQEHVRNFKSLGVVDPNTNFNFVTNTSGSFERLRLDVSMDQAVSSSDSSGNIQLFDFSQNNRHFSGSLFPLTSSLVFEPQLFFYSHISPKFDEAVTTDKIRVRSYQNFSNVLNDDKHYAQVAPVYDIDKSESPQDNTRFAIDFSIVDSLNRDIITMFSNLDSLDTAIGGAENMFSGDYPSLEHLRNIYFNRLTDKVQLKSFFEFYKWFDNNIGMFVSQLIPRKTSYLGTRYVLQSHMLERPKFEYQFADIYLGDSIRHGQKDTILLSFYTGIINKF